VADAGLRALSGVEIPVPESGAVSSKKVVVVGDERGGAQVYLVANL
jgi:hypothetical protein